MKDEQEITDKKQKRRGSVLVYETLREDILWLRIAPGTAIDEVELARRFEVSRTPIREALLLLQGEWLVQFLPNRTSIVAPLTLNNSGEYIDAHLVLSRTAARAAAMCGRADPAKLNTLVDHIDVALRDKDFDAALRSTLTLHRHLVNLTENIFLERYLSHNLDAGIRTKILYLYPKANEEDLAEMSRHQRALVEAVIAADPEKADAAMAQTVLYEFDIVLRGLRPQVGPDIEISLQKGGT